MRDELVVANSVIAFYAGISVNKPVSFRLGRGDICVLTGDNGSGKTSILKVLTAQLLSYSGSVSIFGQSPKKSQFWELVRSGIRYVAQFPIFPYFVTVGKMIGLYEISATERFTNSFQFDIDEFLKRCGIDLRKTIGSLSFGQRRILEISCAFHARPKLIIGDEPTAGLAIVTRDLIHETIRRFIQEGGSMVATAHGKAEEFLKTERRIEIASSKE